MINVQKMMQQAQQMQMRLQEVQEKFKDIFVDGESGGGLVQITMNCQGEIKKLQIDESIIVPEDKETLEDLVVAAINNAIQNKDKKIEEETRAMMEELGMPPGTQLPF